MAESGLRQEEIESIREAAPAIAAVIVSQLVVAAISRTEDWKLWDLPWWVWLVPVVPEAALLVVLTARRPRQKIEQQGRRRMIAIAQLAVISLANGLLLVAVLGSLIQGHEKSGAQLLLKAITLWGSNVITFGLWYWEMDRGGPVRRMRRDPPPPDFLFPQMGSPELAEPGWRPHFFDYLYISSTNAIAFSPTDVLPLTRRAKQLMLAESSASAITILLVVARAINIFK